MTVSVRFIRLVGHLDLAVLQRPGRRAERIGVVIAAACSEIARSDGGALFPAGQKAPGRVRATTNARDKYITRDNDSGRLERLRCAKKPMIRLRALLAAKCAGLFSAVWGNRAMASNKPSRSRCAALAAALTALSGWSAAAHAQATGVWIDHTGRGAVEISNCGGGLCGRIVWLHSKADQRACGLRVIGNARQVGRGRWDGGWIYDPDRRRRYSVEITPLVGSRLKVLGYAGSKALSRTMIWRRAPAGLKRCGG